MVWHLLLPLINSFNKSKAAIFSYGSFAFLGFSLVSDKFDSGMRRKKRNEALTCFYIVFLLLCLNVSIIAETHTLVCISFNCICCLLRYVLSFFSSYSRGDLNIFQHTRLYIIQTYDEMYTRWVKVMRDVYFSYSASCTYCITESG